MSNVKKKTGLIIGILSSLLASAVAFAAFTGVLTINGTATVMGNPFKMVFADAEGNESISGIISSRHAEITGQAEASDLTVSEGGTKIESFNVNFYDSPSDVQYIFKVKNTGGTTAYLSSIDIGATTGSPDDSSLAHIGYGVSIGATEPPADTNFTVFDYGCEELSTNVPPDKAVAVAPNETAWVLISLVLDEEDEDIPSLLGRGENITLTMGSITFNWTSVDPHATA